MNTTLKRVISLMLCFVLMAGILPVGAMAAEGEETVATESTEATQEATEPAASEESSEPEGDTAPSEEVTESTEEVTEPAEEEILTYGLTRATDYLDAAIFCSDVHGSSSAVSSAFNGIKNADSTFIPSTATFVGDTQMAASSVTSAAQSVYSAVACYYAYGNHDSEGNYGISDVTGLLYSGEYYYIYAISQTSMASSNPDTSGFTSTVAGLDKSKPLFIASHLPLHDRRGDSNGAAAWYEAISAAAEQMDIVFFWAHNHTGENDVDRAAFYVAKDGDETFTLENTSTVVTPNFTYMNAGFVGKSSSRGGVVTTVKIYADSLVFQDYTSSGAFTGEYSHNVTVAREFASSTDSGDGDSGSTDTTDPTDPTEGEGEGGTTTETKEVYVLVDTMTVGEDYLIANGNSGTVTLLGQSSGSQTTATAEVKTSGDYTYIETADSGYIWNATAHTNSSYSSYPRLINAESYAVYVSSKALAFGDGLSDTSGAIYTRYWTYTDGVMACVSTNSSSTTYYLTYSDSEFAMTSSSTTGIYIYEKQTITVSSDGTVSGGGDSGDSGNTGDSTETVVGEATVNTATDGSWQTVTVGSTKTETKTVYVLTDTLTAGKNYLIVNTNTAGSGNALEYSNTSGETVTINAATSETGAVYIETSNADLVWTYDSSSRFYNDGNGYLRLRSANDGVEFTTGTNNASTVTKSGNYLYRSRSGADYYLYYSSGWKTYESNSTPSSSNYAVFIYEEKTVDVTVGSSTTYSLTASDIEHFLDTDDTTAETATITKSVTEGAPDGTYTYEIVEGGDDIITSISEDGVITFNGTEGTTQVKVSYTWAAETDVNEDGTVDANDTYTIWKVIDVTATSPYYTINLHKANITYTEATGITEFAEGVTYFTLNADGTYSKVASDAVFDSTVTYYTVSATVGDDITAPVAVKGVEQGDTYYVWAVIKKFDGTSDAGTDLGDVADNRIYWTSSNTNVATVDATTGEITFTGNDGTVTITAYYLDENGDILCEDAIVISATKELYTVPEDGTNDFPEYPNEGAVRFDKNATAVGNFSETGITKVELSMTGVPYSTGSEIDVVIMLDMTGSMSDTAMAAAEESAIAFAEQIVKNEDGTYNDNRVCVMAFNSGSNSPFTYWSMGTITADQWDTFCTAVRGASGDQTSGGTPYDEALAKCRSVLQTAKTDGIGDDRQQFCVFVSDGGPTSYEYITNYDEVKAGTATAYTTSSASATGGSNQSDSNFATIATYTHEYYSTLMKDEGVTMYSVLTGLSASSYPNCATILENIASDSSKAYVVEDGSDTSALTSAFTTIAKEIREAAKDVVVADQITPEYTMIFDIPKGDVDISGKIPSGQEFYIEVMDYAMTPVYATDGTTITDYQRGTGTSKIKLYLGVSNGTYYAASDASGTAFATPAFNTTAIGTMFYWTTDVNTASGVSVTVDSTTYYFVAEGISNTDDSFDAAKWFNMASGAYASGTVNSETNTSTDLVIATPYFVYNASTKMLTWTAEKLSSNELVLSYFLYLDNSATEVGKTDEVDPDSYPTNVEASITYTNYNGVRCQDEFPVPQMTWKGAQVSFVFYLVNEAGQPVNRAGKVVPFSEAVYVTDVHMESMTWNDATASEQFDATQLAADILPDVFQLYDSEAYFEIHVYEVNDDYADYFIIDGSTGVANQKTTKVFNTKADYEHRYSAFGAYSNTSGTYTSTDPDHLGKTYTTTVTTGFDYANTTVAFAVVWKPELVPDTVVVDYGLDVVIDVTTNDAMASGVVGVRVDQPDADINNGTYDAAKAKSVDLYIDVDNDEAGIKELLIGKATVDSLTSVRFSLDKTNGMQFTEPVIFYYESDVNYYVEGVLTTASMYSSVTVIPATTIYYEDEYVTLTTYNANNAETDADGNLVVDSSTTYDATPGWDTSSVAAVATQAVDRPGVGKVSAAYDADNNYGYDKAYTDLSTYSMGSAAMTHVQSGKYATATFSFYGTGFDVISMTSNLTGTITVKVEGPTSKNLIVDTYYGYAQDADGNWVQTDNAPNALYQVPVIKVEGLEYGKYTVTITATYSKYFDHTSPAGYDLYLDAIRIYDPTGNNDETANNAYVADGEGWPSYTELRNNIISAEGVTTATDAEGNITVSFPDDVTLQKGAVFIDSNDDANSIADYVSYGPNNELYLDNGQAVAFNVDTTNVADVQLGIKMANGDPVTYKINGVSYTVDTAADMYYSILDQAKAGTVIIENVSGGILSLTNIKVTFESDPNGVDAANVLSIDEESAGFALMSLRRAPVVETEPTEPEVTEPETEATEPETTAPETEATEPETTAPETEATEPETTEPETEATEPEVTEPETEPTEPGEDSGAEDTIVEVIGKIIKKLFGWLFG